MATNNKKTKSAKKSVKVSKKPTAKTKAKVAKTKSVKAITPINAKAITSFISPLNDRLVVTIPEPKLKTSGGIIIPGSVSVQSTQGKVLAVGPGRRTKKGNLRPPDVKVGDQVLYSEHAGTKLDVQGQEVLILREEEVLGILT